MNEKFKPGDRVVMVERGVNRDFLEHIKGVPTTIEYIRIDPTYASGMGLKILLHHDPIDSYYFKHVK